MRTAGKKRANSARRRPADLKSVLMALTLVLGVSAIRATCTPFQSFSMCWKAICRSGIGTTRVSLSGTRVKPGRV